jgi:hypothetical protein
MIEQLTSPRALEPGAMAEQKPLVRQVSVLGGSRRPMKVVDLRERIADMDQGEEGK